jgi:hypothetical protein
MHTGNPSEMLASPAFRSRIVREPNPVGSRVSGLEKLTLVCLNSEEDEEMSTPRLISKTSSAIVLAGVLSATTFAGDRQHRQPDVDIESLRGELWRSGGEWLLEVRYDVEVEDYVPPPGELELILHVTERDHALVDHTGRSIEFVVPLEYPSEVDDDEVEFEDRTVFTLPDGVFHNPDRLRLEAVAVRAGYDYVLDRKDKSIKFDRPKARRSFSVSVGAGVGVGLTWVESHHSRPYRRAVVRHHGLTRSHVSSDRVRIAVGHGRYSIDHRHAPLGLRRVSSRLPIRHTYRHAFGSRHRQDWRVRLRR